MRRALALAAVTACASSPGCDGQEMTAPSLGTLLRCEGSACWWADRRGNEVSNREMIRQLMQDEALDEHVESKERARIETQVRYLEQVQQEAIKQEFAFSHRMGVTPMHLHLDISRELSPADYVRREKHAAQRRRLEQEAFAKTKDQPRHRRLDVLPTLNWCSTNNPLGKSVCTPIKSQSKCGSCWAFAAADAIEMAVGVATNEPLAPLSSQQFLDCSHSPNTKTFTYCWIPSENDAGAPGNTWLKHSMRWSSKNDGCNGGMTHIAFEDAAKHGWGLVSNLYLPYNETTIMVPVGLTGLEEEEPKARGNHTSSNKTCGANEGNVAASIGNWKQAAGDNCSATSDPIMMLKLALQQEPVSTAVNSGDAFKDYKGGAPFECPNNGEFVNGSKVDHAIVLVGYDTFNGEEYWIAKNSYGPTWGEKGYLHLKMDQKINCGLNIFPIVPLNAKRGSAVLTVDGGGAPTYLGFSGTLWILCAVAVTIATITLTWLGVIVSRRRRVAMRLTHA